MFQNLRCVKIIFNKTLYNVIMLRSNLNLHSNKPALKKMHDYV